MAFDRIIVDPARMVGMILGQLAGGRSFDEILDEYPYLEHEDILAALEYGAAAVNERVIPLTSLA